MKETTVKCGGERVTYCQLMQTQYRKGGSSRQRLVLSLGRADRLDMDALRQMAAAVSRGRADVLTPWLLTVLPGGREYGPSSLLLRTMEGLGLDRYFAQAAARMGAGPDAAAALTALTTYYLLSYQRGTPFFQWLEQCYVPNSDAVTQGSLLEGAALLLEREGLHPGFGPRAQSVRAEQNRGYCCAVPCQYDFLPEARPSDALFLLSGEDVPLDSCLWEGFSESEKELPTHAGKEASRDGRFREGVAKPGAGLLAHSVLLTRDPGLTARHGIRLEDCRFICAAPPGSFPSFQQETAGMTAFLREEGEFLPFREYGYREKQIGGLRAVIFRSSPGPAPALTQWHKEPRELILTNTGLPVETILEKFLLLDKVLDITHPVYLTEDLQFLRQRFGGGEIRRMLGNMQFLQLFLCLYLGRRLARCRTTLDDALAALGDIRCVPLSWEGGGVLLTSPMSPRQQEIMGAVL